MIIDRQKVMLLSAVYNLNIYSLTLLEFYLAKENGTMAGRSSDGKLTRSGNTFLPLAINIPCPLTLCERASVRVYVCVCVYVSACVCFCVCAVIFNTRATYDSTTLCPQTRFCL